MYIYIRKQHTGHLNLIAIKPCVMCIQYVYISVIGDVAHSRYQIERLKDRKTEREGDRARDREKKRVRKGYKPFGKTLDLEGTMEMIVL